MADTGKRKHQAGQRTKGNQQKDAMEQELLRKLPEETQPAEEWGERLATSKAIATGGKSGKNTGKAVTEQQRTPKRRE